MTPPEPATPDAWPPLSDLVQRLREARISLGTTELVNAGRLLRHLKAHGTLLSRDTLRARLRPIFCKSRDDQNRFDDAFRAWIGQTEVIPPPPPPPPPPKVSAWRQFTAFYAKSRQIVWYCAALFVVLGVLVFAIIPRPQQEPVRIRDDGMAASAASVTPITVVPRQVEHYYPAGRSNTEISTSIAWGSFLLPVVALLIGGPAWFLVRSQRRRTTERIKLDERSLREATRHIVPPLAADIAGPLERHTRGSRTARGTLARRAPLHMRRTIEATMRNFGIPQLHFRHTNLRPSYLMLIDAEDEADPRGRLFYMWANRLRLEGLDVDIRKFHRREGQAPMGYRLAARGKLDDAVGEPLDRLPDPPVGQRLIVVSDGEAFADNEGRLQPWVASARFYRWRNRALFTLTEPQDWGTREELIEQPERAADPGFLVLPLEEDALRAWATLLVSGELPNIVLSEPQRYPRLLAEGRYDFLSDTFSDKAVAERLIAQLKLYLGDNGFQWLAALAVAPVVRHPLTLLVGERFFRLANVQREAELHYLIARNYRRLARLPWLRRQCMPNWLRLLLLEELPPSTQDRIREVVRGLLEPLSPTEGAGIAIELDVLPDTRGARVPERDQSVAIYLGYLSGMSARQLAMHIPEKWASWIRKRPTHTPGRRSAWRSATNKLRDWLQMGWAELAFRGGAMQKGARRTMWIVLAGLLAGSLILVVAQMQKIGPHPGPLLADDHHPISFVMRGTRVNAYAFSAHGEKVLTAGDDGRVQSWRVSTGALLRTMYLGSSVSHLAFCGQGDTAVTATSDGTLQLWNVASGVREGPPLPQRSVTVRSVACDESGQFLVVTYDVGTVVVWNLQTRGTPTSRRFGDAAAYAARFLNDGSTVIVAASDGVWSWTLTPKDEPSMILPWTDPLSSHPVAQTRLFPGVQKDEDTSVEGASISLNGGAVILNSRNVACLWSVKTHSPICSPRISPRIIASAISPDGSQFMLANDDGVQLWSVRDGLKQLKVWSSGGSPMSDVDFSTDGQHLVIGDADRAMLWAGEATGFPVSSMDLDSVHGLVSALMAANPVAPTVLSVLAILIIVWLNARMLRRRVIALGAT